MIQPVGFSQEIKSSVVKVNLKSPKPISFKGADFFPVVVNRQQGFVSKILNRFLGITPKPALTFVSITDGAKILKGEIDFGKNAVAVITGGDLKDVVVKAKKVILSGKDLLVGGIKASDVEIRSSAKGTIKEIVAKHIKNFGNVDILLRSKPRSIIKY